MELKDDMEAEEDQKKGKRSKKPILKKNKVNPVEIVTSKKPSLAEPTIRMNLRSKDKQ